jgi:hypothetical protein
VNSTITNTDLNVSKDIRSNRATPDQTLGNGALYAPTIIARPRTSTSTFEFSPAPHLDLSNRASTKTPKSQDYSPTKLSKSIRKLSTFDGSEDPYTIFVADEPDTTALREIMETVERILRNSEKLSVTDCVELFETMADLINTVEANDRSFADTENSSNPTPIPKKQKESVRRLSLLLDKKPDTTENSQILLRTSSPTEFAKDELDDQFKQLETELFSEGGTTLEPVRPSIERNLDNFFSTGRLSSLGGPVTSRKSSITSTSAEVPSDLFSHTKTTALNSSLIPDGAAFLQNASDESKTETVNLPPTPTRNSNA